MTGGKVIQAAERFVGPRPVSETKPEPANAKAVAPAWAKWLAALRRLTCD